MRKTSKERDRHTALLELGVERSDPWKAHSALRLVVIKTAADGQELRVMFQHPEDRDRFLREQEGVLKEVAANPESRKHLERTKRLY